MPTSDRYGSSSEDGAYAPSKDKRRSERRPYDSERACGQAAVSGAYTRSRIATRGGRILCNTYDDRSDSSNRRPVRKTGVLSGERDAGRARAGLYRKNPPAKGYNESDGSYSSSTDSVQNRRLPRTAHTYHDKGGSGSTRYQERRRTAVEYRSPQYRGHSIEIKSRTSKSKILQRKDSSDSSNSRRYNYKDGRGTDSRDANRAPYREGYGDISHNGPSQRRKERPVNSRQDYGERPSSETSIDRHGKREDNRETMDENWHQPFSSSTQSKRVPASRDVETSLKATRSEASLEVAQIVNKLGHTVQGGRGRGATLPKWMLDVAQGKSVETKPILKHEAVTDFETHIENGESSDKCEVSKAVALGGAGPQLTRSNRTAVNATAFNMRQQAAQRARLAEKKKAVVEKLPYAAAYLKHVSSFASNGAALSIERRKVDALEKYLRNLYTVLVPSGN